MRWRKEIYHPGQRSMRRAKEATHAQIPPTASISPTLSHCGRWTPDPTTPLRYSSSHMTVIIIVAVCKTRVEEEIVRERLVKDQQGGQVFIKRVGR